jgi:hypothetical protein
MNFGFDDITQSVREELLRQSVARRERIGDTGPFDAQGWSDLTQFGLLHAEREGMRDIDVAAGMVEVGKGGLPGPVLEAELAVSSGSSAAADLLDAGKVVTSVPGARTGGRLIAGWGSVSELTVDQSTGDSLASGPLAAVETALPMGHGWLDVPATQRDPLATRRMLLGAALLTGLGAGAVELATGHVKAREQFGRTLSSFQAVQFRLAESILELDACELMVADAARRRDAGDSSAAQMSALTWLNTARVLEKVEAHVHQVFGALGFTEEMGLVRMTYQAAWLRGSIGTRQALDIVSAGRDHTNPVPPSTILSGYAHT